MQSKKLIGIGHDSQLVKLVASIEQGSGEEWSGEVVQTLDDALKLMDSEPVDILFVDTNDSGDTIAQFLSDVRGRWPGLLRYVAADVNDRSAMIQLTQEAHQVIGRPWDADDLARRFQNSVSLQNILTDSRLKTRIAGIKSLPCLPETYNKLVSELKDADASINKVAGLISDDSAVTAKVLQVANSAYFGLSNRVDDIQHAVNLLGLDTVQSLVLSAGVFSQFESVDLPGMSLEELSSSSARIGAKSRLLAHSFGLDKRAVEEALLGGMLLDLGRLLMGQYFRGEMREIQRVVEEKQVPLYEAEAEIMGVDSAAIGAYLLLLWGLAEPLVQAVALHHKPGLAPNPILGSLTTVHLAWALDSDERNRVRKDEDSSVDMTYLTALGMGGQLAALRGFCAGATV